MASGILVSYAGYPYALSSLFPDNGLASLAAVLLEAGHDVEILDLNVPEVIFELVSSEIREPLGALLTRLAAGLGEAEVCELQALSRKIDQRHQRYIERLAERLVARCRARRADFVGFKLWSGDGFDATIRFATQIRAALPHVQLYAGGPAVHYGGSLVAKVAPIFDAVIDGDGEEAMVKLAACSQGSSTVEDVPNCVGAAGRAMVPCRIVQTDLASLPLPSYARTVYPSVHGAEKIRLFCIDESRGCPMRCAFCINWCIEGAKWRTRRPEQVVDEVASFVAHHHSRGFRLAGTYSPPKLVRAICEGLVARGLDVTFGLFLHGQAGEPELFRLMKQAGCFGVFIGAESASDVLLKEALNKHVTAARLEASISAAFAAGLFCATSFIYPVPFETEATTDATQQFIARLFAGRRDASVNVCFPGLIPGTTWWQERERFGFSLEVDEDVYREQLLRYKIRAVLPSTLWEELPYRLQGRSQRELARETAELQRWIRGQGVGAQLPDHDALVGAAMGYDAPTFSLMLQRLFFAGLADEVVQLVERANAALAG